MGHIIETQDQRQLVISKKMMEFHTEGVTLADALEKAKKWYYGDKWISDANELAKKRAGSPAYVRVSEQEDWELHMKPTVINVVLPKKRSWFKKLFGIK